MACFGWCTCTSVTSKFMLFLLLTCTFLLLYRATRISPFRTTRVFATIFPCGMQTAGWLHLSYCSDPSHPPQRSSPASLHPQSPLPLNCQSTQLSGGTCRRGRPPGCAWVTWMRVSRRGAWVDFRWWSRWCWGGFCRIGPGLGNWFGLVLCVRGAFVEGLYVLAKGFVYS